MRVSKARARSAQNISLKATNQVNLLSRADEHRTRSTNESRGTGVGVDDRAAGGHSAKRRLQVRSAGP